MKKLLTRSALGLAALSVPAGAALALPLAAHAAPAPTTHINDCHNATAAAPQYPNYPNGCSFSFYDGNAQPAVFTESVYKDAVSHAGNEVEVFIGDTANAVQNNTGSVVTYNSADNPSLPGQTCLSFASGDTTPNWEMTIQPDGEWNLTCNFSKLESQP